ncbi:ubiquitin-related domain-containing protein [Phyllosticta paracitricarpa]|uniref:Ubiquitin-like modifier HUB1 n=1 Tax=Phyllosticta paracitricarpa TaxID=2016321 RepID=A0ABR1NAQ2_9PEZI
MPDSPPPESRNRSRSGSRSPRRERPRKTGGGGGGFRWKEKPSRAVFEEERERKREAGGDHLQRGYRANRSPPRRDDRHDRNDARDRRDGEYRRRSRSPRGGRDDRRERETDGAERDRYRPARRERSPGYRERRRDDRRERDRDEALDVASKFGMASAPDRPAGANGKKDKKKVEHKIAPTTEPMIIVTVNDRLGTKAQIPCLASDPIKLFKAQVAARIGRQPHEIMLKRQGERPFKDQLTLEDYGVSNGVQLDLELDTGD